ncbi:MAG: energy transducer TonB, partial [Cyclobacteriaceae bacterium]|nr:energy transducer TonB [Cyclobacteriaceae bacterium]
VFIITEKPASPPGGFPGFYEYVAGFMVYPQQARKAGIEGRVYVQFIVDEEGYLTDVKAVKGIGGGCDAEAVNIVAAAPRWEPASQRGITVKQRIVLPITFSLGSEKVLKPQGALEPSVEENEILAIVDEPATPTEGYDKYFDYLRNSLVYPEAAREKGIEGKVFVQFVVDEEGTLTDVKVVQGIDDGCDSEAVRVVAASARWNIPRHQGVAVKQRIVLPISFKIN